MSTTSVLHCAESIKGGIATYLRELLPLQRTAFGAGQIVVIVPASQIAELPVPDGVELVTYEDQPNRVRNAFALALAVRKVFRRQRPTVVHIHSTFAGATVRPMLWLTLAKTRMVYCPHGWAWDRPMSRLGRVLTPVVERWLAKITDVVVCISAHEYKCAANNNINTTKLRVVLNGVADLRPQPSWPKDFALQWPEGEKRLLFVGRFDYQKGVDLLCAALEQLGPKASAVLAGGSVLADCSTLAIPPNATTVGWINAAQLETLFALADVLVVPSRWEGFGLIAAEAMRAGLPVIATGVGGLPEVVVNGETGVVIEAGSAQAIATAVLATNKATLQRMGEAGKQRFQRLFTMSRVHAELCQIYVA